MGLDHMTRFKYEYIHAFKDRHGKQRYYYRRKGQKRIALPGKPGTQEFHIAYCAAASGETAPKVQAGANRNTPGSMRSLILAYYQSMHFKELSEATQRTYRGIMDRIAGEHGDKPVKLLQSQHVHAMKDQRRDTPAAARNYVRMIRLLMQFAIERGWRQDDPTTGIKTARKMTEGFRSWTDDDIAKFEERWPLGTRAHLALSLLLYTGQRRSDVVKMGRQHRTGSLIHVQQQKTKTRISIPIHPKLAKALDAVGSVDTQLAFLVTQEGKPFTPPGFTNWFVECAKKAGLPDGSTPHGLRKAAARRLAQSGCSPHQIMAITGHRSLKEVAHYTNAVNQVVLAQEAINALS